MKTFEVVCPHCNGTFEVEMPEKVKKPRGQLAGIALEDMTDEQLKRELINANSVLYKAKQRGASEETIAANAARVEAAKAEKAPKKTTRRRSAAKTTAKKTTRKTTKKTASKTAKAAAAES